MKVLVNFGLSLTLAAILLLPIISVQLVIKPFSPAGVVAGLKTVTEKEVNVIPNFKDFNGYVSFDPGKIKDGRMQDNLGITVFQRQKALYRGLYSVYNISTETPLEVELKINREIDGKTLGQFEFGVFSLHKDNQAYVLLNSVDAGDTLIKLENPGHFQESERILVGQELVEVVAVSSEGLVVTPLRRAHGSDEVVYHESIVIANDGVTNPRTQTVILEPGEKAMIDGILWGSADLYSSDRMVNIPVEFKFTARPR